MNKRIYLSSPTMHGLEMKYILMIKEEIMKKILFIIPSLAGGGAEKVLVNMVKHLDRHKYDITVQCLFDVGVNKQYLACTR